MQQRSMSRLRWGSLFVLLLVSTAAAVREKRLYDILGVPTDADEAVIKKAYRKQAL